MPTTRRAFPAQVRHLGANSYGPMNYAVSLRMGTRQGWQQPPHVDVTGEQKTQIKSKLGELELLA